MLAWCLIVLLDIVIESILMIKFNPGDIVQRTRGTHNSMIAGDIAVVIKHHSAGTGADLEITRYGLGHAPANFVLYEEDTIVSLNKRELKKRYGTI
jgi:hypothetical protein